MAEKELYKWSKIRISKANKAGDSSQKEPWTKLTTWKAYEPEVSFETLIDIYENNTYAKRSIDLIANNVINWWFNIVSDTWENSDQIDKDINTVYNMIINLSDENFLWMIKDRVVDLESTWNWALEISRWFDWKPAWIYRIPIAQIRYARPQAWDTWKKWQKFILNPNSTESDQVYYNKYQPFVAVSIS